MKPTFVMITLAGPNRDLTKSTREQPFWDEHAEFIDRLVAEAVAVENAKRAATIRADVLDAATTVLTKADADAAEVRQQVAAAAEAVRQKLEEASAGPAPPILVEVVNHPLIVEAHTKTDEPNP